jgi:hypothetical protein
MYTNTVIDKTELTDAVAAAKDALATADESLYEILQWAIDYGDAMMGDALATSGMVEDAINRINDCLSSMDEPYKITVAEEPGAIEITVSNNADKAQPTLVIIAVYDSRGVMVTAETKKAIIPSGEDAGLRFAYELTDYHDCTYKVFAWDSETFIPLTGAVEGDFYVDVN